MRIRLEKLSNEELIRLKSDIQIELTNRIEKLKKEIAISEPVKIE